MSAHTKGPWAVGGATGFVNQVEIHPSIGCAYGAGDEVIANARLIAAAPDLLAALIDAREQLVACAEAEGDDYNDPAINAAIQKATGAAQ